MADENHTRPAEAIEQSTQVPREIRCPVRGRHRPLALTVSALIEGDHVEPLTEPGDDAIEPVRVRRAAMEKAHRGRAPPLEVQQVQPQCIDVLTSVLGTLASEQLTRHSPRLYGCC
jgi:hypothetical protein